MRTLKFILIILFGFTTSICISQDYNRSVGLRSGTTSGIEAKVFTNPEIAYTGILGFKDGGLKLTAHRSNHQPFLWTYTDKLFAYWGFGAHVGHYTVDNYENMMSLHPEPISKSTYYTVIGLDGVLGMEYRLLKYPFVVSMEFIPYFDLFGSDYFNLQSGDATLSIKYTF